MCVARGWKKLVATFQQMHTYIHSACIFCGEPHPVPHLQLSSPDDGPSAAGVRKASQISILNPAELPQIQCCDRKLFTSGLAQSVFTVAQALSAL